MHQIQSLLNFLEMGKRIVKSGQFHPVPAQASRPIVFEPYFDCKFIHHDNGLKYV